MSDLDHILFKYENDELSKKLIEALDKTRACVHINDLYGSSLSMLTSVSFHKLRKSLLCVLPDKEEAAHFHNDLQSLMEDQEVYFFCDSFRSVAKLEQKDATNIIMRTEVQEIISGSSNKPRIIVSYPEAMMEKMILPSAFKRLTKRIKKGDKIDIDSLIQKLYEWNFDRVDFVIEAGQFSIRGGIIDIFSYGEEHPYRIELFDDEVENIRLFNLDSQLSIKTSIWAKIIPDTNYLNHNKTKCTLLDILDPEQYVLLLKDFLISEFNWKKAEEKINKQIIFDANKVREGDESNYNTDISNAFADLALLKKLLGGFKKIECGQSMGFEPTMDIKVKTLPQPSFNKNFELLTRSIKSHNQKGYDVHLFSSNPKQIERFYEIFEDIKANVSFKPVYKTIHEGFINEDIKLVCYTDHQIFNRFNKYTLRKRPAKSRKHVIKLLQEMNAGDYIVHVDHGVGKYAGIQKIKKNDSLKEVMKVIYHGGDVLYVNIHSLHKVSKYVGKEGAEPKVNKLGSESWERLKSKTKKKVKDIAHDLIKIYAERRSIKGFSFSPDTYLQNELEASFIYEDTPDQLKASTDVKADMEADYPMDRLVCGDVGFGKTEIAMRAAFKAITDSKQVAILVPTTILAFQHYTSFKERFKQFPCNIDYLSRFRSQKEITQSLSELESGKTDIIIGTHKLLSKNVVFKDLGLMVIDEEQKFGVGHKEQLRNIRANIDTLTLTATPIPRTLQFSLMGARDLSIINTPPPNRQPIETAISVFNADLISDAVNFELSRGGQVFFIHNRIKDLEQIKDLIISLNPQARVITAHGKLKGNVLEEKFMQFMNGKHDVLLSTSLVESGIDMPNVNTIIINNAQNFGLSDLHQLRGRVGRSNRKAFCYLFSPPFYTLSSEARKRLRSLEEFSDLGSGFNIAMRDMDIRGAGNLLGAEQSGFIAEVGLEMFHRILDEAILELKEKEYKSIFIEDLKKEKKYVRDVQLETDYEIMIPDWYVNNVNERLSLYTRIDKSKEVLSLDKIRAEIEDRFGPIPKPVDELFAVVKLRWKCCLLGIERIIIKKGELNCVFIQDQDSSFYSSACFHTILNEIQKRQAQCQLKQTTKYLMLKVKSIRNIKEVLLFLDELVK